MLIPPSPGVASAIGLLMTDIKHEYVATRRQLLEAASPQELVGAFTAFEERAAALLAEEREDWAAVNMVRALDLRYRGQSHELQVVLPGGELGGDVVSRARSQFEEAHQRAYGYTAQEDPIELVNLRLTAVGRLSPLPRKKAARGSGDPAGAQKGERRVWFQETGEHVACIVYDRYRLRGGDSLSGPAVIEEMDSSTIVLPGYGARVDEYGNLLLESA